MRGVILGLSLIALGGCGKGSFREQASTGKVELRQTFLAAPATFDPAYSQSVENNDLMNLVFEGLVGWGKDNKIEPRLAESWEVSMDGRTYTFRLRPDLKFSDGTPLTSKDFKRTWERNLHPLKGSPLAQNYLGDIVFDDPTIFRGGYRIVAKDPNVLVVTINEPKPSFLGKLTYPAAFPIPSATKVTDIKQMIGAGPYVLESYEPNLRLILKPNPNYRGEKAKHDLKIRIVPDAATRIALLKGGEIDSLSISQQDIAGVLADPELSKNITQVDRAATVYIGMNGTVYKPFADQRVREAFVCAVDRDFIAKEILRGFGLKANGIIPPTVPGSNRTSEVPAFDPVRAKQLLKEAGWEGKLPTLDLWANDAAKDRRTIAEYVCSQLRKNLGVDAKVRFADSNLIIQKATKRELGFFYGSWYADYLDPENFLSVLLSSYGQNRTNYDNPRFSDLCRRADRELDPAERARLYGRAENLALGDCPWIPLYHPQDPVVVQPWVKGLERNAFGILPPTHVSIER